MLSTCPGGILNLTAGMKVQLVAAVLAAVSAAVLVGVALATFLPMLLQPLLDSTPRTAFSTSAFISQFGTALPAESRGFLVLAAVAAVMGFIADRLQ